MMMSTRRGFGIFAKNMKLNFSFLVYLFVLLSTLESESFCGNERRIGGGERCLSLQETTVKMEKQRQGRSVRDYDPPGCVGESEGHGGGWI